MNFPRLLYRGPADEHAEYLRVADEAAYISAKQDGWRLQRALPPEPDADDEPRKPRKR